MIFKIFFNKQHLFLRTEYSFNLRQLPSEPVWNSPHPKCKGVPGNIARVRLPYAWK